MRVKSTRKMLVLAALVVAVGAASGRAQDKLVKVVGLEVDGAAVESKYKIRVVTGEKVLKARTSPGGFLLPEEVVGKDVGVIFEFKGYTAMFFLVSAGLFDEAWVVGVDKAPFVPEYLGDSDASNTAMIYYVRFPESKDTKLKLVTVVGKPKVTVKRT